MSLTLRVFVVLTTLVALAVLGTVGVVVSGFEQEHRKTTEALLTRETLLQAARLVHSVQGAQEAVEALVRDPRIQTLAHDRSPGALDAAADALGGGLRKDAFQARVLDVAGGRELIRIDRVGDRASRMPEPALQDKSGEPYMAEARRLGPGRTWSSAMTLNREHGAPDGTGRITLRVLRTLESGDLVLVLNLDASTFLRSLPKGVDDLPLGRWYMDDAGTVVLRDLDADGLPTSKPDSPEWIVARRLVDYGPPDLQHSLTVVVGTPADTARVATLRALASGRPLLVPLLVGLAALAVLLATQATRPIVRLERAVRTRASPTRFERPEALRGEAAALADTLERALLEAEHTATVRTLAREAEDLVYVAAHDLKGPIRTVAMTADLLDARGQEKWLERLKEATGRMQVLIDGLKDVARSGRPEAVTSIDLGAVARDTLAALDAEIRAAGAVVSVGPLPRFAGHPRAVATLLRELLRNAVAASRPGRPVNVWLEGRSTPEGVELVVRDDGVGIAPEHRAQVFRLFGRLDGVSVDHPGIGLARCRRIATLHAGSIHLDEAEEGGARFTVVLRAAPPATGTPSEDGHG
ncbi:MAG: HAMP domain-containing histidine kinase [Alphaproteobacteria bacterium]|nr:HAMP domain-containing histidine kinase [Alphaproteobacteria bacterium]